MAKSKYASGEFSKRVLKAVKDLELVKDGMIQPTPEQQILVALSLNNNHLDMREISQTTDISYGTRYTKIGDLVDREMIFFDFPGSTRAKTYHLEERFIGPAKLLTFAFEGRPSKDIHVGKTEELLSPTRTVYQTRDFAEGLHKIMDLILEKLPEAHHGKILYLEEDPCLAENPPKADHWFYTRGISTQLQSELGNGTVETWVKDCDRKGIGEVVINDLSFSSRLPKWKQMRRLESHEYWLIDEEEPPSEGYIAFENKLAIISWKEKTCVIYDDANLARMFRNDVLLMRLTAEMQPICCEEHRQDYEPDPNAPFYVMMRRSVGNE